MSQRLLKHTDCVETVEKTGLPIRAESVFMVATVQIVKDTALIGLN